MRILDTTLVIFIMLKLKVSPVLATWYICSKMMREKYELKAHYY
jgi:hypothetical protein